MRVPIADLIVDRRFVNNSNQHWKSAINNQQSHRKKKCLSSFTP
jgi:hypothetical protein